MIHDPQLRQLFELKKSISVTDFYELSATGLVIDYVHNDIFKTIDLNVAEACSLLKEAGLITYYENPDPCGGISLQWETETNTERNGDHIQECKTRYGTFREFVEQTQFSANDANEVAAFYELRKITNNQKTLA